MLLCVLPFAAWNQWVAGHPWPNTWSNKFEAGGDPTQLGPALVALGSDTGWGWALLLMLFTGAVSLSGAVRELPRLLLSLFLPLLFVVVTITAAGEAAAEGGAAASVPAAQNQQMP